MKNILSIVDKPPFTYLLYPAYRTSILMTHQKTTDWFLSSFVQFSCNKKELNDFGIEFETIPFLKEKDIVFRKDSPKEAIFRIINYIDDGKYISLTWDESLVACRPHYSNEHYKHMVMIFGYDLNHGSFEIIGFSEQNIYEKRTISFEDFSIAYSFFSDSRWKVFSWKKRKNRGFNLNHFNKLLLCYRKSYFPLLYRLAFSQSFLKNKCFGFETYNCLTLRLSKEKEEGKASMAALKALTAYCEHKNHLVMSFKLIKNLNLISEDKMVKIIEEYEIILKEWIIIRNIYLKYYNTMLPHYIDRIIDKINLITSKEKRTIDNYLKNIKSTF